MSSFMGDKVVELALSTQLWGTALDNLSGNVTVADFLDAGEHKLVAVLVHEASCILLSTVTVVPPVHLY